MKTAWVWFNGPSRDPLLTLPKLHTELGCNLIRHDRPVDHVCCFDWQMQRFIEQETGVAYWTAHNSPERPGWRRADRLAGLQPHNSGTLAVVVAVHHLGCDRIRIMGCDWGISTESVYRYDHVRHAGARKYTLSQLRVLEELAEHRDIQLVADAPRAIDLPRITTDQFISQWT